MLNPYVLLAILLSALGLAGGSFAFGVKFAHGQEARAEQLVIKTREQAQLGAAEAIAKIEIKNTTIRQRAETITREKVIYTDCRNDPVVVGLLNDALANREPKAASDSQLPGADAPRR